MSMFFTPHLLRIIVFVILYSFLLLFSHFSKSCSSFQSDISTHCQIYLTNVSLHCHWPEWTPGLYLPALKWLGNSQLSHIYLNRKPGTFLMETADVGFVISVFQSACVQDKGCSCLQKNQRRDRWCCFIQQNLKQAQSCLMLQKDNVVCLPASSCRVAWEQDGLVHVLLCFFSASRHWSNYYFFVLQ